MPNKERGLIIDITINISIRNKTIGENSSAKGGTKNGPSGFSVVEKSVQIAPEEGLKDANHAAFSALAGADSPLVGGTGSRRPQGQTH
jgi:hypothetical protein